MQESSGIHKSQTQVTNILITSDTVSQTPTFLRLADDPLSAICETETFFTASATFNIYQENIIIQLLC